MWFLTTAQLSILVACSGTSSEPVSSDPPQVRTPVLVDTGVMPQPTGLSDCVQLAIEPHRFTVETGTVQLLAASGGTGHPIWSVAGPALGTVSPSGIYGAPDEPGTDTIVLRDSECEGQATAQAQVVAAMVVRPTLARVPPNGSVMIDAIGGSGAFGCVLESNLSGATLSGCSYLAGPTPAVDVVRVTDNATGASQTSVLHIEAGATLHTDVTDGWMIPLDSRLDPVVEGGGGRYHISVADPSIAAAAFDADLGVAYLVGGAPGSTTVTITDAAVAGLSLTRALRVIAPAVPPTHQGGVFIEDPRALSRDLNGDGFPELIIGNREASVEADQGGVVMVFVGGPAGPDITTAPLWQVAGTQDRAHLGKGVAVGDVDGDGIDDILIGSPDRHWRFTSAGEVGLYLGDGAGSFEDEPFMRFTGAASGDRLGHGVGICDVDGDGLADVLMSSQAREPISGTVRAGAVVLYRQLASGGFELTPVLRHGVHRVGADWVAVRDGRMGEVGFVTGDFDHDGLCDVAAALDGRDWTSGEAGSGYVLVWSGDAALGLSTEPTQVLHVGPGDTAVRFGRYLAVGQVDGNGGAGGEPDDLLIGAEGYDHPLNNTGAAFLFAGTLRSGFVELQAADATWSILGSGGSNAVGEGVSISPVGDLLIASRGQSLVLRVPGAAAVGSTSFGTPPPGSVLFDPRAHLDPEDTMINAGYAPAAFGDGIVAFSRFDREIGGNWRAVDVSALHSVAADGTTTTRLLGRPSGQRFGRGFTLVDTDGDGSDDLVVGGGESSNPLYGGLSGEVFARTGGWTRIGDVGPTWGTSDRRGWVLSRTDFDGDGSADLVVGARNDSRPEAPAMDSTCAGGGAWSSTGHLEVYLQRGGPLGQSPDFLWWPSVNSGRPDELVGGFDADGDGYQDLLAGLSNSTVSLVYGEPRPTSGVHELCRSQTFSIAETGTGFGLSVAALGDLDGDGCDEVAIGAPREHLNGVADQGTFRVLWGYSDSGQCNRTQAAFSTFASGVTNVQAGQALSGGVDVDGDGVADLAVGGTRRDINGDRVGDVWLVSGAYLASFSAQSTAANGAVVPIVLDDVFTVATAPSLHSRAPSADFGRSVALIHTNAAEWLAVGAPEASQQSQGRTGGVSLHRVVAGAPQPDPAWWIAGESFRSDSEFGERLGVVGGDLIIGAPGSSALGGLHTGGVYVVPL